MTRITAVWTLSLLLLSGVASADPEPWMKKEKPDELGVYVERESECPEFDIQELVHGVLIRSRVRPLPFTDTPELYLNVNVRCIELDNQPNFYSFSSDIRFSYRASLGTYLLYEFPAYGTLGHGGSAFIQQSIKESVESAITDYLQANFDL